MSVSEKISAIKIKGGIFDKEVILNIFANTKNVSRFCLLYGKNGSGKSTISRAFTKIQSNKEDKIDSVNILDKNSNEIIVDDSDRNSIYVFNEQFIEDNIRIDGDGLNAIVVLGAKKDIDDQINILKPHYDELNEEYTKQMYKCDEYADPKNNLSPEYYKRGIIDSLKGDANWAGRSMYIHGLRQNAAVKEDTYKKFMELKTSKTRDELILEYDRVKKIFESRKTGSQKITKSAKVLLPFRNIEAELRVLLNKKIEKPILSEREQYLFSLLETDGGGQLQEVKTYFSVPMNDKCPFCFQHVGEEYKSQLTSSIEKILSKKTKEHQENLNEFILTPYEVNYEDFKVLDSSILSECNARLQALNNAIITINEFIAMKKSNVYLPVVLPEIKILDKFNDFIEAMQELENNRIKYNQKVTSIQPIIEELDLINNLIAMYDIRDLHDKFIQQSKDKTFEDKKKNILKTQVSDLKRQIIKLEEEKKNVRIAMDKINDDLKYIFFSKDRLRIDYQDGMYLLYSHGKSVDPNNISVGERNAIGLSYFFNNIMKNKDKEDVYNNPYILIIDDPVSSFDMENRVGIMSYLKFELDKFVVGNKDTRILIMTHDLQTLFDSMKVAKEIIGECKKIYQNHNEKSINIMELQDQQTVNLNLGGRHEYTYLLEIVYKYALDGDAQYSFGIGNIMRKVLEAFGTFIYKQGIENLSTDQSILDELDDPYKKYFKNLMYRLVLHGGSHMEERTKSLESMDFFDYISDVEKQRTAKDVICFLYKLNFKHVLAHLKNINDAEIQINTWCRENIE